MADFIAVIRRAVDGLAENTPEMRVKVYDRARGAVQRQLENMKPRPPEAMLQRQMDKLEAAIREVEAEHADALPAEADDSRAAAAPPVISVPDEPVPPAPAPVEPVPVEPDPVEPDPVESVREEAPAAPAPAEVPVPEPEPVYAPEPEPVHEPEPVFHPQVQQPADASFMPEPAAAHMAPDPAWPEGDGAPIVPEPAEPEPAHVQPQWPEAVAQAEAPAAFDPVIQVPVPAEPPEAFVEHSRDVPLSADAAGHFDEPWHEPAAAPAPLPETPAPQGDWALEELREFSQAHPVADTRQAARGFDEAISRVDEPAAVAERRMPEANADFSWEAAAFDDLPPVTGAAPAAAEARDPAPAARAEPPAPSGEAGWQEATALRDYDRRGTVNEDDSDLGIGDMEALMSNRLQGKSFRMEPKRRRFGIGSLVAVIFLLALIGGGYAAWINREELTSMATGLVASAPGNGSAATPGNGNAATPPAEQQQAAATPQASTPAAGTPTPPATGTSSGSAASTLESTLAPQKFTQRLMADGAEVDNGPAPASAGTAEGKSVAQQTVAANTAPPAAADTPPANAPAAAPGAATATQQPAGVTEKMFLYEERVGQGSPTAIQGSVAWSLQHEPGQNGRQEAEVRGTVTVPGRNLTALLTFKRNGDSSLPASHIVEIVFSLPPNFEGGAIDSVQRISMKRTEQDRGDALVAVPAKITDDFHMIALNDFPDARKANLDLLGTRDWMDIPITYRNGRRALLTLQKGTTGGEAFTKAIAEWAAMGDAAGQ